MTQRKHDPAKCPVCGTTLVFVSKAESSRCPGCARSRIATCERLGLPVAALDRRIVKKAAS